MNKLAAIFKMMYGMETVRIHCETCGALTDHIEVKFPGWTGYVCRMCEGVRRDDEPLSTLETEAG